MRSMQPPATPPRCSTPPIPATPPRRLTPSAPATPPRRRSTPSILATTPRRSTPSAPTTPSQRSTPFSQRTTPAQSPRSPRRVSPLLFEVEVEREVKLNRQTTLSALHRHHDPQAYVEYPETGEEPVGYLFRRDPQDWKNPTRDFAYSLGLPSGRTQVGKEATCLLLVDSSGTPVPCVQSHFTCA
ncbi:hypothetical protein H0H92_003423 [Tricholoma furcatifolium]|nr:hypothetical protein H0H92_003423 [Tricholoma furcatifolium]